MSYRCDILHVLRHNIIRSKTSAETKVPLLFEPLQNKLISGKQ